MVIELAHELAHDTVRGSACLGTHAASPGDTTTAAPATGDRVVGVNNIGADDEREITYLTTPQLVDMMQVPLMPHASFYTAIVSAQPRRPLVTAPRGYQALVRYRMKLAHDSGSPVAPQKLLYIIYIYIYI